MKNKKKLPKFNNGGSKFKKQAENFGMAMLDNTLTTITSGAGANIIKQDQYDDTDFGRSLGETQALKESMDSMSPIAKIGKKFTKNPQETGYNQKQQELYNQAQPIAQMGSSIGEMWAGKGLSGISGKNQTDPNTGMEISGTGQSLGIDQMASGLMQNSNQNAYSQYRRGGMSYPTNAIPIHGGNWAIPTFNNGGRMYDPNNGIPNAEIEKQEVVSHVSGGVQSFDLNSHENATSANQLNLEGGAKILSDTVIDPLTKKPFAKNAQKFDTSKEEKILKDNKASTTAKNSANYNFMIKKQLFDKEFKRQEAVKAEQDLIAEIKHKHQLENDLFKCGGIQQFGDGGKVNNLNLAKTDGGYAEWRKQKEAIGWVQSPLADPKSPYPDMYDPKALDIQKTSNVGINDHVWKAYDNTDYTYKALNPKALDAFGYKSPDFYGSYTPPVTKKAVSTQQFKVGYTPSPEGGSYMMINDPNPNARYQYIGGAYQPIQKQAYGGVQKFDGGGTYIPTYNYTKGSLANNTNDEDWNAIANMSPGFEQDARIDQYLKNSAGRYLLKDSYVKSDLPYSNKVAFSNSLLSTPTTQTSDTPVISSVPNLTNNTTNDRTDTFTRNGSEEVPYNRDLKESLNDKKEPKKDAKGNKFNKDAAFQAGMLLANNAGPLAYMLGEGKKHDKQKFYKHTPPELDFTPTKRAYDSRRRAVLQNVKNMAAGHSGAALANIAAQNADLNVSEDNAMREFANQMAGIRNQSQQFNIQGQYAVDDINARNKGQALTNYYKAIGQLGTNTAQAGRDYRMTSQEKEMLPFMQSAFSDPAFMAMYQEYLKKKGVA